MGVVTKMGGEVTENTVMEEEKVDVDHPLDMKDNKVEHLQKMSQYKTYAKGLMDIALLTANANQLRHSLELCQPFRTLLIVLLSLSIFLQVAASVILLVERLTCSEEEYSKCVKYNATIGVLVIVIIVINILATAFGGPGDECEPVEE